MLRPLQVFKAKKVEEIKALFASSSVFFFVQYSKLKISDFEKWKQVLKEKFSDKDNIVIKVYKNTLFCRALANTKYASIQDSLSKMLFVVAGNVDGLLLIKTFAQFINEKKNVNFLAGVYDQQVCLAKDLYELSLLPSREELLRNLILTLKFAPLDLVLTLNEVYKNKNKLEKKALLAKT